MDIVAVHNTLKVRPRDAWPLGASHVDLAAAGNQAEIGQLVLRAAAPTRGVPISSTPLTGPDGATLPVELFRQHYIRVERVTTPAFEPGWYPDALEPLTGTIDLEADTNLSVWLKVHVPEGQRPGNYAGAIRVGDREVPVRLRVWDFALPSAGHCRTAFAIWYDQVADYYGLTRGSAKHWELAERFYWFQLEQRLPADDLPIPASLSARDWLAAAARFLEDPRVIAYRIPARAADPTWTRDIVEGLRAAGWLERGYFYLDEIDEPTAGGIEEPAGGAARVHELCAWLDEIAPEVEHLVTAEPVPELEGAVTTWVPLFDRYEAADARARQAKGETSWWYGCVYPTHPYPSYHIDDDLMAARVVPWLMHRDRIDGNLYWATTIFSCWDGAEFVPRDVWTDPMAWPGANGDGQLIYPGPDGPLPSIRLEAIRAGQDDYEYLWLLEQELSAAARADPDGASDPELVLAAYRDRIVQSAFDFARGAEVEPVRRAIAEHILRLRGGSSPQRVLELGDVEIDGWVAELGGDTLTLRTGPNGEHRPSARWLVKDFSEGDVVEIELSNRRPVSTALFVTFLRDDGVRHEAARAMVDAQSGTRIRVPIDFSLMAPTRITGFQIEMMPHQPGADLEVAAVAISSASATRRFRRAVPEG
ncbi:DUF4091 domain-containing protein [Agromyces subbeticus]|uniref:DUF4091 domain-containing protein n=1 Tax=Agromyces subbeticus TaxID=293890 RepID=UPI0003B4B99F|nr:DUF4091 domain-containing protein [Agromyces subbeticus]